MVELDKTSSRKQSNKRKRSLKGKGKMTIITYVEDCSHNENYVEQLEKINEKLNVIFEKYYSHNTSIERIMSRRLLELIKIVIFERKNK